MPILLFAVAFGLSTDYAVFLLSRIKEARDNGASDSECVAIGLERTGRIVTAAALLFAVAMGAFATSQIIFIKENGVGTALAVLIDASIVRALLVPSLMELLGKWNWWAPAPLRRLHDRFGIGEHAAPGPAPSRSAREHWSEFASSLPGFEADTAVEDLGGGRFAAAMSERWWVGKGPNGGYVAAVILRAIQASASAERAPRSLTVHFQRAPLAGPVEIAVEVVREGGRVTFLSARMKQEGKVQATAQAVLSENWGEGGFSELTMPDAGEPGELPTIDPEAEHSRPNMLQNYRLRPALGEPVFSGGAARTGAWIRTREPRLLDAPLAAAFLDTWFPAPFVRLERPSGRRRSTTPSTSARRCRRPAARRRTPT